MKVLFMANIPSPYRVDFFNELGKYCDLTVTFEGKNATDRNKNWIAQKSHKYKEVYLKGIRTKSDQFLCKDIIKIIKGGFDQIIVGGYSSPTAMLAIEYMRIHKILFWLEADGGLISKESGLKYKVKRHFISSASGWFSSGKSTTKYLTYYGAEKAKICEYPFSSIREEDIMSAPLSNKTQLQKKLGMAGAYNVISVGQFIYRKGFDILLKAWKGCPEESHLYIIGDTPTEEYLKIKNELGLGNVHFVGFKTKEQLKEYYQAADLFVLPTREDIWGLVINEAMANALPVITTDRCVAGLELVENGTNGYIVTVEDVEKLKYCIMEILSDEELRKKIAQNNLKKIKSYTVEKMAYVHINKLKGEC